MSGKNHRKLSSLLVVSVLVLLHFGFGMNYLLAVPAWESYDEPGHFGYAVKLAHEGKLPSEGDAVPNSERIQPPLYYLFLASILRLSNSDVSQYQPPTLNPYFHYGTSGRNYALHSIDALTPGEVQTKLALITARVASLLLSLFGVAFIYRAARLLWPQRPGLQYAATALYALWPQLLFNSSVVSNDGPAAVIGAILTWLLLQFHRGRPSLRLMIACLMVLAIGATVKLNLLIMLAPIMLVALFSASPRLIIGTLALGTASVAGVIVLLKSLPSVLLPFLRVSSEGDNAVSTIVRRLGEPGTFDFLFSGLRYALDSAFGLFGWGNLPLPPAIQNAWFIGAGLIVIGVVISLVIRRNTPLQSQIVLLAILGSTVGGALGLVLFYKSIHLIPGRYLLPALPAFCLLAIIGLSALRTRLPVWGVVTAMVLLGAFIPFRVIAPDYTQPPTVPENTIPNAKTVELAPGVLLLGFDIPPVVAYPGDVIPVDLYWKAARLIRSNLTVRLELIGPDGQGYGLLDTYPGNGNYATSDWAIDQAFKDRYLLYVRQDFPAPALARLKVSLQPDEPYKVFAQFGEVAIHSHDDPTALIDESASARFGERLLLRGTVMELHERTLNIHPVWQATGTMGNGTIYVHVEQPAVNGTPIAQHDSPPRDGKFPLSYWIPGERVADSYTIMLPDSLAAGRYPIRTGIYDPINPYHWRVDYKGQQDYLLLGWLNVDAQGALSIEIVYPAH